jgi:hypothetical protein
VLVYRLDFVSHMERGIAPPVGVPDAERLMSGLSVFYRLDLARAQARRFRRLGRFVATLDIPDDGIIPIERTGTSDGHHTIWGDPDQLLARVVSVESV